jgi:hypothetical protein
MRLPRLRFTVRRMMVAVAIVGVLLLGVTAYTLRQWWADQADRVIAGRQEARARRLVEDAPLANLRLLSSGGLNPFRERGDAVLTRINPIHPGRGLTRPAGPTIEACRRIPGGVPAELILRRGVPLSDPALLGPYSSRSTGNVGSIKQIEFFTYGHLDVGIKDGSVVVIRVR